MPAYVRIGLIRRTLGRPAPAHWRPTGAQKWMDAKRGWVLLSECAGCL